MRAAIADREELDRLQSFSAMEQTGAARFNLSAVSDSWKRYVRIDIQDNGCGMSQEILSQIFDPFFTTKKGGKGTGLGLALVEQIISSHRGGLYVESQPGKGSIFRIYLPVNEQSAYELSCQEWERNSSYQEIGSSGKSSRKVQESRLKLLIVDDNPKVLRLLEKDAAKLHIRLDCRMSFPEALNALNDQESGQPFDAFIAEQNIAGHSAVDFCMSIQGQFPDLIKIIMADRVTRELAEARQRGIFNTYIDKPVSLSSILEALKNESVQAPQTFSNLNNL